MNKHPEWVTKHKRKGTEIRFINGHYYMYEVSSKWDKTLKRSKKITGKILGKITEKDGFIESDKSKLRKGQLNPSRIYCKEYGAVAFFDSHLKNYEALLQKHFPDYWREILVLAFVKLLHQSTLKNVDFHYLNSYISTLYPDLKLKSKDLTELLRNIGNLRLNIVDFFKEFSTDNDSIIFDGTDLVHNSRQSEFNKFSKTKQGTFDNVDNLMFIFSTKSRKPLYYRIIPGNIKDVKSFKLCLTESGIEDAVIIADKGFYSKANLEKLQSLDLQYIIPLKRNNSAIEYEQLKDIATKAKGKYFKFEDRIIWTYESIKDGVKINLFFDEELRVREIKDYLNRIETHPEAYSLEKFEENQHTFGTIALMNNLEKSASEVFSQYKSRNQIELMIDALKNILEADKSYMQNDRALEGWMFVNHIALMWYYELLNILKNNELNKKFSPMDILRFLKEIKKINIDNTWYNSEITKGYEKIIKLLAVNIT